MNKQPRKRKGSPLSDEQENALKKQKEDTESEPFCCICLCNVVNICRVHPCLHVFCLKCLFQWARIKHSCPLCKGDMNSIRFNILSSKIYDEYYPKEKLICLGSNYQASDVRTEPEDIIVISSTDDDSDSSDSD